MVFQLLFVYYIQTEGYANYAYFGSIKRLFYESPYFIDSLLPFYYNAGENKKFLDIIAE